MQEKEKLIMDLLCIFDNEQTDTSVLFYWVKSDSTEKRKLKGAMIDVAKLRSNASYFSDFIDIVYNSEDFLGRYDGIQLEEGCLNSAEIYYPIPPTHIYRYKIVDCYDTETREPLYVVGPEDLYNIAEDIINLGKTDSSAFKGNSLFISKLTENKKNFAEVSVILHTNPKTGEKYLKPLKITITQ